MKNTSTLDLTYAHEGVNLLYPFGFTDNEPLPAQLYRFDYGQIKYVTDRRREIKLTSGFRYGSFYNGTRTEFSLAVDYRVQPWGNFSLNFVQNDLDFLEIMVLSSSYCLAPRQKSIFLRISFGPPLCSIIPKVIILI